MAAWRMALTAMLVVARKELGSEIVHLSSLLLESSLPSWLLSFFSSIFVFLLFLVRELHTEHFHLRSMKLGRIGTGRLMRSLKLDIDKDNPMASNSDSR